MPPNSVFDEPVTNLLSTLCILIEILSGARAKGSKRFKLISNLAPLLLAFRVTAPTWQ